MLSPDTYSRRVWWWDGLAFSVQEASVNVMSPCCVNFYKAEPQAMNSKVETLTCSHCGAPAPFDPIAATMMPWDVLREELVVLAEARGQDSLTALLTASTLAEALEEKKP